GDEGNRARSAWIRLQHEHVVAFHGELDVDEAPHLQCAGEILGDREYVFACLFGEGGRRGDTGRVSGVHACFLDVFHHSPDQQLRAVEHGVDVYFDRSLQEAVYEDRGT